SVSAARAMAMALSVRCRILMTMRQVIDVAALTAIEHSLARESSKAPNTALSQLEAVLCGLLGFRASAAPAPSRAPCAPRVAVALVFYPRSSVAIRNGLGLRHGHPTTHAPRACGVVKIS